MGGAHLKLTLLDGANVRGGIGFQQGDLADRGYERVDVLFSPEVNEFRGQRTVQLNVAAMKQTGGSLLWPDEKMIFSALLQELTALASNYNTLSSGDTQAKILPLRTNQLREKLRHLLNFKFKKHSRYNLPEKRLRMMERQVQKRVGLLLSI